MEPEAVAAGLVAGEDRGVVRQGEAAAGEVDLAVQGAEVAGGDGDAERRLAMAVVKASPQEVHPRSKAR